MNNELLEVDPGYFSQKRDEVASMLYSEELPKVLNRLDRRKYFASPSSASLYEIIEETMSIFPAVRQKLDEHFRYDTELKSQKFRDFLNLYAVYLSAGIGYSRIKEKFDSENAPVHIKVRTDFGQNPKALFEEYLRAFARYVRDDIMSPSHSDIKTTEDLVGVARLYLKEMRDLALDKKNKFTEYLPKVEGLSINVNGSSVTGFEVAGNGYNAFNVIVGWDEIIGNSEPKRVLQRAADRLFLYDFRAKENVFSKVASLPTTYHLHSRAGTGKTTILQALRTYMGQLSADTGKAFHHVNITSMFESKWFGESVKELDSLLAEGTNPNQVGLVTIEDIDKMFVRLDDPTAHSADRKSLNHLLNVLEGINTRKEAGNYMIVSTKNQEISEVLLGRIAQVIVHVPGPVTPQEYIDLLKLKLKKGIDNKYVVISNWEQLGKLSREYDFSGRDIRNCVLSYLDEVTDVEIPKSIYRLDDEDRKKDMLVQLFLGKFKGKAAGGEPLLAKLEHYQKEKLRLRVEEETLRKQQLLKLGLERRIIDREIEAIMQSFGEQDAKPAG